MILASTREEVTLSLIINLQMFDDLTYEYEKCPISNYQYSHFKGIVLLSTFVCICVKRSKWRSNIFCTYFHNYTYLWSNSGWRRHKHIFVFQLIFSEKKLCISINVLRKKLLCVELKS